MWNKFAWTLAMLAAAGSAWAHSEHQAPAAPQQKEAVADIPASKTAKPDARAYFTDTVLVNQDGKKMRFYSDVLEGHTVLINVIYTNCKDACPLITQKLIEVKGQIGDLFGKEVRFVSISNDPIRDTPAALKAFARKEHADLPGWVFLTGDKKNVELVLKKLGQFSQDVEAHSTLLIAGNVPEKRWSKIRPDAPTPAIVTRLQLLVNPDAMLGPLTPPKAN